jgi:hypothetical protein
MRYDMVIGHDWRYLGADIINIDTQVYWRIAKSFAKTDHG